MAILQTYGKTILFVILLFLLLFNQKHSIIIQLY